MNHVYTEATSEGAKMSLNKHLDKAKEITGSDYATAKRLRVTPQTISMARKNGSMSNELARELAELVGCSPLNVIAAAEIAKHPERSGVWAKWAKTAAVLLAVCGLNISGIQELRASGTIGQVIHYAQRWARRVVSRNVASWTSSNWRPRLA